MSPSRWLIKLSFHLFGLPGREDSFKQKSKIHDKREI